MPLSAAQICSIAQTRAKVPGFTTDAGLCLNLALQWFALQYDFEINKASFNFNFDPATTAIGNTQAQLASGPFILPADYLRAKRGDIQFYPVAGYPFQLTPIDLEEFDHQWQQAGFQNYPVFWVTDTTRRRDWYTCTANFTQGSATITNISPPLDPLLLQQVSGNGLLGVYGALIFIGSRAQVISISSDGTSCTLDRPQAVIGTGTAAVVHFATNALAYVWPPAGGSYPCFVRYYRKPHDLASPTTNNRVPWFEFQDVLIDAVTGRLMHESDDERAMLFLGEGQPNSVPTQMRKILQMKDDYNNRSRRVNFDRRRFGPGWSNLPKSKATFGF
jgi:hypothetical protein